MIRKKIRRQVILVNEHPVKKYYFNTQPWAVKTLKRDNFACRDCKGIDSLIVHHIDESRKNGWHSLNNNLLNLITLCRSCHAKRHHLTLRFVNPHFSFILDLREQGKKYYEIGQYLGITRQRVHQIIKKAQIEIV